METCDKQIPFLSGNHVPFPNPSNPMGPNSFIFHMHFCQKVPTPDFDVPPSTMELAPPQWDIVTIIMNAKCNG